ncbi:MAG: hypothetical protein QM757_00460 [Paludibaculum sp.]
MSSIAVNSGLNRTATFYHSVVGKKVVMAVTGFVLSGFVLGHMIGNLQVYQGPEKLNHYAELLQSLGRLLWFARFVLLAAAVLHVTAAFQLWRLKNEARPQAYVKSPHCHQLRRTDNEFLERSHRGRVPDLSHPALHDGPGVRRPVHQG